MAEAIAEVMLKRWPRLGRWPKATGQRPPSGVRQDRGPLRGRVSLLNGALRPPGGLWPLSVLMRRSCRFVSTWAGKRCAFPDPPTPHGLAQAYRGKKRKTHCAFRRGGRLTRGLRANGPMWKRCRVTSAMVSAIRAGIENAPRFPGPVGRVQQGRVSARPKGLCPPGGCDSTRPPQGGRLTRWLRANGPMWKRHRMTSAMASVKSRHEKGAQPKLRALFSFA